jgi:hypothetical protein
MIDLHGHNHRRSDRARAVKKVPRVRVFLKKTSQAKNHFPRTIQRAVPQADKIETGQTGTRGQIKDK